MRQPGWYAIEDDGNLSSGLFHSRQKCVKRITQCVCRCVNRRRNRDPLIAAARLTLLVDLKSDGVPTGADRDPTTTGTSY